MKSRITYILLFFLLPLAMLQSNIAAGSGRPARLEPSWPAGKGPGASANGCNQDADRRNNQKKTHPNRADGASESLGSDAQGKLVLNTELVNVPVAVRDSEGRYVAGLTKERFKVYDDDVGQEIEFFSDEDLPLTLGIVYDVSGSMKEHSAHALQALRQFLELSNPKDEFFVITFNDRPTLAQEFTSSVDGILRRLATIQPDGQTALYDAVYLGVEKLQHGHHTKKALLIISDGEDNNSDHTERDLRDRAIESDGVIYAIGTGSRDIEDVLASVVDPKTGMPLGFGPELLKNIATMTGGRALFPDFNMRSDVMEAYSQVALELRHQYVIGYYPSGKGGLARRHKIKVTLSKPKGMGRISLSYRRGYISA